MFQLSFNVDSFPVTIDPVEFSARMQRALKREGLFHIGVQMTDFQLTPVLATEGE